MDYQATHATCIKLEGNVKLPRNMWEALKKAEGDVGTVDTMLFVCSKEMNQLFLFPLKHRNHKIVKIFCELEELTPNFVQEITEEITDFEMEKVHITGVTTNDDGFLVFEGYYSTTEVDRDQLENNIKSIDAVSVCTVEIVE
ncbi:MAG: hypothetical protein ACXAEU_05520 [Candidatus Hodarchaeales archaeon]|jgi:hypothetical protein